MQELSWAVLSVSLLWNGINYVKIKNLEKRAIQKSIDELTLDIMRTKLPVVGGQQPCDQDNTDKTPVPAESDYFG